MKKLKKAVSILLALVMVLSMSVTAFAADTTYTITITNTSDGYVYTAYQIFAGDVSSNGETLSNVTWSSNITNEDNALEAVKAIVIGEGSEATTPFSSCTSAADVADVLSGKADDSDISKAFAEIISSYVSNGTDSTQKEDKSCYIITVTAGYYLIKNTSVPEKDGAYTSYILEVVGNVTAAPKSDIPSLDKTIGDINDSTEIATTSNATDSADHDIGDDVPFTLTATLPTYYGDYDTYKLVFYDTMTKGLTFNNDVEIVVDGTNTLTKDTDYTVESSTNQDGGTTITITIADLKTAAASASAGSEVVVTYTAKLNNKASYSETNKAYLEYSNNPNNDGSGDTGRTPDDTTTVFNFTLTVDKVDEKNKALTGAGFTLYKLDADTKTYVAVGSEVKGEDMTSFEWKGLDDGEYKLVETTTPDGYNTMEDYSFTIVATHSETGISVLTIEDADGNVISGDGLAFTTNINDGTIKTTIENNPGATLPSTGGIGTTIFYVVGGILVVAAAVLLITKGRMSRSE